MVMKFCSNEINNKHTLQSCSVYFSMSLACNPLFFFYLFRFCQDLPCSRINSTFIFFRDKSLSPVLPSPQESTFWGSQRRRPLGRSSDILDSSTSKRSAGGRSWNTTHHNADPPTFLHSCSSLSSSMRMWMTSHLSMWPLHHISTLFTWRWVGELLIWLSLFLISEMSA